MTPPRAAQASLQQAAGQRKTPHAKGGRRHGPRKTCADLSRWRVLPGSCGCAADIGAQILAPSLSGPRRQGRKNVSTGSTTLREYALAAGKAELDGFISTL